MLDKPECRRSPWRYTSTYRFVEHIAKDIRLVLPKGATDLASSVQVNNNGTVLRISLQDIVEWHGVFLPSTYKNVASRAQQVLRLSCELSSISNWYPPPSTRLDIEALEFFATGGMAVLDTHNPTPSQARALSMSGSELTALLGLTGLQRGDLIARFSEESSNSHI